MPVRLLTARFIDAVKSTARREEYRDTEVRGLVLRVTPAGAKTFVVRYYNAHGRERRLTLGSADVITLAKARVRARDELYTASKGADPATTKQAARTAQTVGDLAAEYIAKWAKPRKRSWKADDNLLRHKILPKWRYRAITEIQRRDCRELVEGVAEAGAPIVANRVAALLSKMFGFALDRDLITVSPAVRLPRPGQETKRDRVLTDDEIREVWASFEALDATMGAFYKLRLLTMQRGGEVVTMRWADLDLEQRWWTIPATNTKNKLAHRVPLNASAVAIITGLRSTDPNRAPSARFAYALAGARGRRQQAEAAATFTIPNFVGHDLRRTAASIMASGGIPRLTIKKLLNHVERDVTAVYDRHSYDPEKAAAMTWWDAKLAAILENTSATVLPFSRAAAG
jgi:integrase